MRGGAEAVIPLIGSVVHDLADRLAVASAKPNWPAPELEQAAAVTFTFATSETSVDAYASTGARTGEISGVMEVGTRDRLMAWICRPLLNIAYPYKILIAKNTRRTETGMLQRIGKSRGVYKIPAGKMAGYKNAA